MPPETETTNRPPYLDALNPEQREAVRHFEGPLLVLAGAGSGKTRVLTARIAHLIHHHGVAPDRILAVTFTNKAAGEMKERVAELLGSDPSGLWIGTFHSVGARLLRRHADRLGWSRTFTIFDAQENLRQVKRTQEELDIPPRRWNPKAVRSAISDAKNALVGPAEYRERAEEVGDAFARKVAEVYPAYQEALREQNAFDFDDLLVKPVRILDDDPGLLDRYRERFAFVLVDEYQDTNHVQYRFLELLAREHGNLMVVGDDDQSIYGWRGADIRNILDFEETFPDARVVRLERNYRSTARILEAANAVISENTMRKGKTLRTSKDAGEALTRVACADDRDEASWIVEEVERRLADDPGLSPRDFAVLYRTNAQSRSLEEALRRRGVPYQIVGGLRFYERREIMDVLAYLRLISNPLDAGAFDRIVNYPKRGIGRVSQARLLAWADEEGVAPLEAARRAEEIDELPTRSANSLLNFADLIDHYAERAKHLSAGEVVERLLEELEILRELREEGPDGEDRADNVRELIAGAAEFDAELHAEELGEVADEFTELDLFLQRVALITDIDRHDPESDAVTLMTLHNAKGLEFPFVFISGLEEGLFPLSRAYETREELEEERRLFYVGITRGEEKVYLTHARIRRRAGELVPASPSSFIDAVPEALLEERRSPRLERKGRRRKGSRGRGASTGGSASRRRRRGKREEETWDPDDLGREELGEEMEEAALNQDLPRFEKGERVAHPTFGSGTVVRVDGYGRDLKVVVDFDGAGEKKLLARYASLEKDYF